MARYTCQQCGKEFKRYPCNKRKGTFCSSACYHNSMKKYVEIECAYCGKKFLRKPYKIVNKNQFCSLKCSSANQKKSVEKKCATCGEEILLWPSRVTENNFCSKECSRKFPRPAWNKGTHFSPTSGKKLSAEHRKKISEAQKGEKHWNWQGGKSTIAQRLRVSMEYREWRKRVFERDNYTCQECGSRGGYLHAHHIEEFSKNEDKRVDVDNGATLCFDCHSAIHNRVLTVGVANG